MRLMRSMPFLLLFAYAYHTVGYALGHIAHTWVHVATEGFYRHHAHHHVHGHHNTEVGAHHVHHGIVQTLLQQAPDGDEDAHSAGKPFAFERLWHMVQYSRYTIEYGEPSVGQSQRLLPVYSGKQVYAVTLPVDSPPPE